MEEDQALQFFPDGNVDLYAVLEVTSSASAEEIRKAYRRRALRLHPDKLTASGTSTAEASHKFQQLGFSYAVLSDPARKKRYDDTGRTDESLFADEEFSWQDYFRELWDEVCGEKLNEFKAQYVGSEEEKQDVYEAYRESEGSLLHILENVPCAEVLTDEDRIVALVEAGIQKGELQLFEGWTRALKDTKGREKMRRNARKEAAEAEAHAKELGVWDELFGDGKKRPRSQGKADVSDDQDDEEDEEPVKPTKRARAPKAKVFPSNPGKGKKAQAEDEDLGGLAALIQKRQAGRGGIGSLIARLEADANAEADARHQAHGGKGKREHRDPFGVRPEPGEPTEEEFLAAQQRLFGDKDKGKKATPKGKTKGKKTR